MSYATGYFASEKRSTRVHVVKDGIPMCGTPIGEGKAFQFCAPGYWRDYADCQNCKRVVESLTAKGAL